MCATLAAGLTIGHVTLLDLVAIDSVACREVRIARRAAIDRGRRSTISRMVPLPIGAEVPFAIAHATVEIGPPAIKREAGRLLRRRSDRPILPALSRAGVALSTANAGDMALSHIRRWPIVGIIAFRAHAPFVNVESDVHTFACRGQCPRAK